MTCLAVITTTASREEAQALAQALVEQGLAACVQLEEIESFYIWKGSVQRDMEYRVVAKTTEERYPEVERAIKEMHSYELPAIYGVPLSYIYAPYAQWVESSSQPAPK